MDGNKMNDEEMKAITNSIFNAKKAEDLKDLVSIKELVTQRIKRIEDETGVQVRKKSMFFG
jgi:hypothetical protein